MRLTEANLPPEIISKKTGRISAGATSAYVDASVFEKRMSSILHGEDICAEEKSTSSTVVINSQRSEKIEINPIEKKKMKVEIDGEQRKIIVTFD